AAQVGVDNVADPHEIAERFASCSGRKVQAYAALVAIEHLEEEAVFAALVRRNVASDITAAGRFLDLDDLCADIGQVNAAERPGAVLFDSDDPKIRERLHAARSTVLAVALRGDATRAAT